jgi:predicted sulfurtransferase
MKYILKENNYYSHVGTDPVDNAVSLDFDKNFSLEKLPTEFHYWNGEEFVLDTDMYRDSLQKIATQVLCKNCDDLQIKLQKNESYSYLNDYNAIKDDLISQLQANRSKITTFSTLSIQELEQFVENN